MREELTTLWTHIERGELPADGETLFGSAWDKNEIRFVVQETYILDYKDKVPSKFSDGYGAGIVRLILAMYNSFGGLIVFGVNDRVMTVCGVTTPVDAESLNRVLSDATGRSIECITRSYVMPGLDEKAICVLLVPRRGSSKPVKLQAEVGPYPVGKLWIRDRHEVLEADAVHLPTLYSSRLALPAESADTSLPIHRSMPPSPATMADFIGRKALLGDLWDWFVFGDQPRMYLSGPGGSGKSTLAYEFARSLAENGYNVSLPRGERVDYVIYISAKETELHTLNGKQQRFQLRQFDNAESQFQQILYHSGHFDAEALTGITEDEALSLLEELFSSYSGLVVIDDIDALSRRKVDTGEEPLFLKSVHGTKRTKILYTLRYPPSYAMRSSLPVPGLSEGAEFHEFLDAVCEQFNVSKPTPEYVPKIDEATSALPLLIETVIGLRKHSSSYKDALADFKDKGGDDARQYLYQREYDQLDRDGKAREVLAALFFLKEPVSFTTIVNLLTMTSSRVRDAISECGSIFLTTIENEQGETLYQLATPAIPFVCIVSEQLNRVDLIRRRVELFVQEGARYTPEEAALIVRLDRLIRKHDFSAMADVAQSISQHDPVMANPRIRGLIGQAYAELGGPRREQARECFRAAEALNYFDIYMMRAWYHLEYQSGYGIGEARALCERILAKEKLGVRYRSEFLGKLGRCYAAEAQSMLGVSREKAVDLLSSSALSYLESLWIGRTARELDPQVTLNWLDRTLETFVNYSRGDIDDYLSMIGSLPSKKWDISPEAADSLIGALTKSNAASDDKMKAKAYGYIRRTIGKIDKGASGVSLSPGMKRLRDLLVLLQDGLSPVK
ncbi:hypothetical protein C8J44_2800 [Sphingomonas sp. PP-CE-3A-406]|uniref:RNA-binding domain-containing protein n=1 Tax=Sphingomonas sp. PP-CE-3A-406 TaxID=2135659 RepID=UPI000F27898C|nr:RNA-binding domain-containing protein [Sphingomonas sp. PP-CE-3A-406]RMB51777.1 hypothetical protein C8J44_2800 [Sphingomonas sp. PP-CE-3A-406]